MLFELLLSCEDVTAADIDIEQGLDRQQGCHSLVAIFLDPTQTVTARDSCHESCSRMLWLVQARWYEDPAMFVCKHFPNLE
jgi:hypothetical protein